MTSSYLEIILGCMFSGKTSKLIEIYKECVFCNISVCVINHSFDTRYGNKILSTHDNIAIPCIQVSNLKDLLHSEEINNADVILINEAQFFQNLKGFIFGLLEKNKKIYIAGLDGDFQKNKFGEILDLIPHADSVVKLTALCGKCKDGTKAIFSLRLADDICQTLVGVDNYIPVCRKCYLENCV